MKAASKTIVIACHGLKGKPERYRLDARVLGGLALHRSVHRVDGVLRTTQGWNVSHVRTGLAIAKSLSYAEAHRLLKELQGLDWDFGKFGQKGDRVSPKETRTKALAIVEAL